MLLRCQSKNLRTGFTLLEVIISFVVLGLVTSGILYGYVQMNRMATWSSWSLAAQSCASQGLEQARGAQWYETGGFDQWVSQNPLTNANGTIFVVSQTNTLDVPSSGALIYVTNYIRVSAWSISPPLRMIRSDCVWFFPQSSQYFTNSVIGMRAPDQ